ncbi:uncharacterized protein H6S33_009063 [Morchella sextelata]|uniref:uncharacterized protein n=1 Tax=Morchella sextelata TaxID=1174677 RepID=UPI001D050965|nr:uncharacterized protein H6S33_009063 [Morchella sextelata]KAH0612683.1 hypothetical protein H6S33_009063 [Morchella sextelata]
MAGHQAALHREEVGQSRRILKDTRIHKILTKHQPVEYPLFSKRSASPGRVIRKMSMTFAREERWDL